MTDHTLGPVLQPPLALLFSAECLHIHPRRVLSVLRNLTDNKSHHFFLCKTVKRLQSPCQHFEYKTNKPFPQLQLQLLPYYGNAA